MNFVKKNVVIHGDIHDYDFFINVPKRCQFCSKESIHSIVATTKMMSDTFAIVTKCNVCEAFNLATYKMTNAVHAEYIPNRYTPACDLTENLEKLSPKGAEIYKQSLIAESLNLDEIFGMGLRKTAEFFIKDFLIKIKKKDKKLICKTALTNCINMIDNPLLHSLSRAAVMLGNDVTHYEQRFTNEEIEALKEFIKYALVVINTELSGCHAAAFLTSKKK